MPVEVKIGGVPAGYPVKSARKGEHCSIIVREFTSSEDGDLFISRLEGFPSELIGLIPDECHIHCSTVDNLLAIIRRDRTVTLYVNELQVKLGVRAKCTVTAGQAVIADDIADIETYEFVGVDIPPDSGIIVLFSEGWRKGLYYDFAPLHGEIATPRDYDLGRLLAQHYAYLGFQHLFKITDDEWDGLLSQQWFPFISMRQSSIKGMIDHLRAGFDLDGLAERVAGEFGPMLSAKVDAWRANPFFQPHIQAFETAVERHQAGDYFSSTSVLYPRLEGLMRTYHLTVNSRVEPNSQSLVKSVTESGELAQNSYSLFLPKNFRRYLKEVYFAGFDPRNPKDLSRNTVSHGVAPVEKFTLKSSLIGLLILDQLSYFMRHEARPSAVSDAEGCEHAGD
jgi:hypothetical protein